MKKQNKVIEIEFEDQGQDFLKWKIEYSNGWVLGEVIDSQPFQNSIWKGYYVLGGEPKIGECVQISKSPEDEVITIKYPIVAVKTVEK